MRFSKLLKSKAKSDGEAEAGVQTEHSGSGRFADISEAEHDGPETQHPGILTRGMTLSSSNNSLSKSTWSRDPEKVIRYSHRKCSDGDWYQGDGLSKPHHQLVMRAGPDAAEYIIYPEPAADELGESDLCKVAAHLNTGFLTIMTTPITSATCRLFDQTAKYCPLSYKYRLKIVDNLSQLKLSTRATKSACFLRDTGSVLLWADEFKKLFAMGEDIEKECLSMLYQGRADYFSKAGIHYDEKEILEPTSEDQLDKIEGGDLEIGLTKKVRPERPDHLLWSMIVSASVVLIAAFIGTSARGLIYEIMTEKDWTRLAVLAYLPFMPFFSAFFASILVVSVLQLLGPINHMSTNSRYYSATKPINMLSESQLPSVTIQLPVYKESLHEVLIPTIESLLEACEAYELQGGSANILICDDGYQTLAPAVAAERKEYYTKQNLGWVARPPSSEYFQRRGAFKKASNMNYAMYVSTQIERYLERDTSPEAEASLTAREAAKSRALQQVLLDLKTEHHETCAGGDLHMGELLLIVDSDTRVPADAFLYAANEFAESPELAILQHVSGVLLVTGGFFERAMSYFTKLVYFGVRYVVAAGDTPPFFGHNAFLRLDALLSLGDQTELESGTGILGEKRTIWWSESHVSEDFELALKLQSRGYSLRLAAYHGEEFKEGVCLTIQDEITRWEKYAFGCSEMIFNPFRYWFTKSPFTPLFREFLRSKMSFAAKFGVMSYMCTYFAMGSYWIYTLSSYLVLGWDYLYVSKFFTSSWSIWTAVLVVFPAKEILINPIIAYRLNEKPLFSNILANVRWAILLAMFFGGLSLHVSRALTMHLCGFSLTWGSTAKSLEHSDLRTEIYKIWARFKYIYILCSVLLVMMLLLAFAAPDGWRILGVNSCVPLLWLIVLHVVNPVLLNPQSYMKQ